MQQEQRAQRVQRAQRAQWMRRGRAQKGIGRSAVAVQTAYTYASRRALTPALLPTPCLHVRL